MRSALTLATLATLLAALAPACGSSPQSTTCTKTQKGAPCVADADCCTGYCLLESGGAYCQDKPAQAPTCITATGFCTQNRNCCDGLCKNNACFGTVPTSQCLELGSQCGSASDCCDQNCQSEQGGLPVCVPASRPVDAGACLAGGAACGDPSECCTGICIASVCAGAGNPMGNCGASGSTCRYGADCCSQQCIKLSSTSQCK